MSQQYYESWVDKQIREAQERGDFDGLPGAGKPLPHLGDPDDADWWVKGYIKRENLDISGALPTPLPCARRRPASRSRWPTCVRSLRSARSSRTSTTASRPTGCAPPWASCRR